MCQMTLYVTLYDMRLIFCLFNDFYVSQTFVKTMHIILNFEFYDYKVKANFMFKIISFFTFHAILWVFKKYFYNLSYFHKMAQIITEYNDDFSTLENL